MGDSEVERSKTIFRRYLVFGKKEICLENPEVIFDAQTSDSSVIERACKELTEELNETKDYPLKIAPYTNLPGLIKIYK